MFSVALAKLKAEEGAPFPLYLFLKRNDRMVPVRLPGDPIGLQKYEQFLKKHHEEVWVPNTFLDIYNSYLQYAERNGAPVQTLAEAAKEDEAAPAGASAAPDLSPAKKDAGLGGEVIGGKAKSEEAKLVGDVLEDQELTTEEKSQVFSAVSQDLMRALNQITTRGEPARAEGIKRCREIADEVLRVASQNSNIYDEILALRSSQEDIEHSVIVGTMAAMFGMAIGFSDEKLLADLTVGAVFHDIGLVKVKPEVMAKKEISWTLPERQEYEKHVEASAALLRESGTEFHPRVFKMIEQHHENYDGSGFPKRLSGAAIDETSAILHLANLFDRLCTGKQTGTDLSPAEAFDYIYEIASTAGAVQEVQPELIQRVFQFMLTEKTAADAMKKKAEKGVMEVFKEN
jgi:putative nucleotidyltransferase with HDIG domain